MEFPVMLETNLAQSSLVLPAANPYFKDIPEGIPIQATATLRKDVIKESKERLIGKTLRDDNFGEVGFSATSLKEIFNQPHAQYVPKNQLGYGSNLLSNDGKHIAGVRDTKGDKKPFH